MTPEQYCQQKAARSGSSFYYSFLFLPQQKRRAIMALYAFCREVDDVVDECHDPDVAARKLAWWREEIEHTFQGRPTHPVGHALRNTLEDFYLPQEYFLEIIDGMEMDLHHDSYPSFSELALYCHRVAGVVGLLAAEIFGHEDRQTTRYANELGIAFQLTNILRDVGEDLRRGRIYIPLDEMERFGVWAADLGRGQTSERLRELFAFQADRARDHYRRAFALLPEVDRYAQRSGLIMAAVYQTLLDELAAEGYRVLEGRIHLTPLRKLWIAWRTARSERRRHQRWLREARA